MEQAFEVPFVVLETNIAINAYATNYRCRVNSMNFSITSKYTSIGKRRCLKLRHSTWSGFLFAIIITAIIGFLLCFTMEHIELFFRCTEKLITTRKIWWVDIVGYSHYAPHKKLCYLRSVYMRHQHGNEIILCIQFWWNLII